MNRRTYIGIPLLGVLATGCGALQPPPPVPTQWTANLSPYRAVKNGQEAASSERYELSRFEAHQIWSRRCAIAVNSYEIQNFVTPFTQFGVEYDVWQIVNMPLSSGVPMPANMTALINQYPPTPPTVRVYIVNELRGRYADNSVKELNGAAPVGVAYWHVVSRPGLHRDLRTIAHELGHNFGLGHVTDPLNVMVDPGRPGNLVGASQCQAAVASPVAN